MENRWWMFVGILASDGRRSATGKEPLCRSERACVWAHSSSACHRSIMYPGGDDKSVIAAIYTPIRATFPPPANRSLVHQDYTVFIHYIYIFVCLCVCVYKMYVPYGRTTHPRRGSKKKTFFLPFLNIMHIVHAYVWLCQLRWKHIVCNRYY